MKTKSQYNKVFEKSIEMIEHNFPEEFNRLDWNCFSGYRFLSPQFIRRYKDKLNWKILCTFQHFSFEFIAEFIHYVSIKVLFNTHGDILPKESEKQTGVVRYLLNLNDYKTNYSNLIKQGVVDNIYKSYSNDISNRTICSINKTGISDDQLIELTISKTKHYYNVNYMIDYEYSSILSDKIEYIYMELK